MTQMVSIIRCQTSTVVVLGWCPISDTTTVDRPDKTLGQMNLVTYASYILLPSVEHFEF